MKYKYIMPLLLLLSACNNISSNDTVILYRKGEVKKSEVTKIGVYCGVSWYKYLEQLLLRDDGTVYNPPFEYKWTLFEFNSEQDKIWFKANCKQPPNN